MVCLEACPIRKSDLNSLDFVVNRFFFMKLLQTSGIITVNNVPSALLKNRDKKLPYKIFKKKSLKLING